MKIKVRVSYIASFLAAASAVLLIGANLPNNQPEHFTAHEWGTFTSVAGEDGAAIDWNVLDGNDDLPRFVNDRGFRCFKFRLSGTVRMETPVLYFYSPAALDVRVRVALTKGMITEWYPQAEYQADQRMADGSLRRLPASLNGFDTSMMGLTGGVEWKNVKIEPETAPPLPQESGPSRYYAARATDSAPVSVGSQHEKFLFYRGVGRFAIPISTRVVADDRVIVTNTGADPMPAAILFENRAGHIGYRNAGALSGTVTLNRPSLDASPQQLRRDLELTLAAQGLFSKEAHAMVETWQDSWFEEGSRIIYILPTRAVDAFVPLRIDPRPSAVTRVFVGRMELITPETEHAVEEALLSNDRTVMDRYGRFLDPILRRIAREKPSEAGQVESFLAKMPTPFSTTPRCQSR